MVKGNKKCVISQNTSRRKKLIRGGTHLLGKRPEMYAPEQWPPYYSKAHGCEVIDTEGNRYVKGGVKPWRGSEQNRSAHSYVYPGPPEVSIFNSPMSPVAYVSSAVGCPAAGSSGRWLLKCAPDASDGPATLRSTAPNPALQSNSRRADSS